VPSDLEPADYARRVTAPRRPTRRPPNVALRALARFGVLLVVIAIAGLLLGFGIGWPLSKVNLDVRSATQLDHVALAGSFDPELAEVQPGDLPGNYTATDADLSPFALIGGTFCGETPSVPSPLGDKLVKSYTTGADNQFVISEVQRVRRPIDANNYVRQLQAAFDGCTGGTFFRGTGASRVQVRIKNGQPNPPVNDYVSYTLTPDKAGGTTQLIVVFQVGDVVVAVQFAGTTRPPVALIDKVQLSILARCVPAQFGSTKGVNGVRPIPTDVPTTTTTLPPTTSTSTTTTTAVKRKKTTTTAAPVTVAPPATSAK